MHLEILGSIYCRYIVPVVRIATLLACIMCAGITTVKQLTAVLLVSEDSVLRATRAAVVADRSAEIGMS